MQDIQKHKIREYLWEADYISLDYNFAKTYMDEKYIPHSGQCTAFRKGNLVGRNLDEIYDNSVTTIINVPAIGNNHASIGVVSGVPSVTEEFMQHGEDEGLLKVLPFFTVDGINDAGLFVEVNLLTPEESKGRTTGTIPRVQQNDKICALMLPRYILDHYVSVDHAVQDIRDNISVYAPMTDALDYEYHFMLADTNKTVILEFVNNQVYVREVGEGKDYPAINSNFYVHGVTLNADKTITRNTNSNVNINGVTKYGSGIERHNKIISNLSTINNLEEVKYMMHRLFFTNAYTTIPRMYSEFVSNTQQFGNLTITTPDSQFTDIINHYVNEYNTRDRYKHTTWQTIHSVVYDLSLKAFQICVQESTEYYRFSLNNTTNKINKDFLYYTTVAAYQADVNKGIISDKSIVFVKEDSSIITHGHNFITGSTPSHFVSDVQIEGSSIVDDSGVANILVEDNLEVGENNKLSIADSGVSTSKIASSAVTNVKVASDARLANGQLATASYVVKGGIKTGENFNVNDDEELEFSASYTIYVQSLEDRIAALELLIQTHIVTIDCKSEVSAGGEVLNIVVNNNFEATDIQLTCENAGLVPQGSGKNWTLNVPMTTTGRLIILKATASKDGEAPVTAAKTIIQPKAILTIDCSKTTVSSLGETIIVTLNNNFDASIDTYELTSDTEGISITPTTGGQFEVAIGTYSGIDSRNIKLVGKATKDNITIQAETLIIQQGADYIVTIDCKSEVGAGGETINITVENNFEATNIELTCRDGETVLTPTGSGKNWTLAIPVAADRAHQFTLTAKASRADVASVTATKVISQPKAVLTVTCSKTTVSYSPETITIDLTNNFGALASSYQIVSTSEGMLDITHLGDGHFSALITRNATKNVRIITFIALAVKNGVTVQTEAQIVQEGRESTYYCWIGHAEGLTSSDYEYSINKVLANDDFKIEATSSSIRGDYTIVAEDRERLVFIFPSSFGITPKSIYDGAFEVGAAKITKPLEIASGIMYDFIYTDRLYGRTHLIKIN